MVISDLQNAQCRMGKKYDTLNLKLTKCKLFIEDSIECLHTNLAYAANKSKLVCPANQASDLACAANQYDLACAPLSDLTCADVCETKRKIYSELRSLTRAIEKDAEKDRVSQESWCRWF